MTTTETTTLPGIRPADQARVVARVLLPAVAEGLVQRRPSVMALAERLRADRAAVDTLRELRERYGRGPLGLRVAGRSLALLLDPDDLARVLSESPEPFTPAVLEKRRALEQFQPHGSLISVGPERRERRRVNELALETERPLHDIAPAAVRRIREEALTVRKRAEATGLTWDVFAAGWWRSVRRLVLGDAARADRRITDSLAGLRTAANWSLLRPTRRRTRADFLRRLRRYAAQAGDDTLVGRLHGLDVAPGTDPVGQVPHWLFAFDAAGAATLRTLALLTGHPGRLAKSRAEFAGADLSRPHPLRYLRACVLDAVRLWPTTPLLLRESTLDTVWRGALVPAGTAFVAHTPYFHRVEVAGPYGDEFEPEIWLDGRAERDPALAPFSAGPARCPGENLVLLTASTWLAALLEDHSYRLDSPVRPRVGEPIPATLNHFPLRFTAQAGSALV